MPWLIKNEESTNHNIDHDNNSPNTMENDLSQCLFFVHVPRCGGTSLMKHFDLPLKVRQSQRRWWNKLGMAVFFSRYETLESRNFPVWTWGNFCALCIFVPGVVLIATHNDHDEKTPVNWLWILWGSLLCSFAISLFLLLTVVFTAPVIARCPWIHRSYLLFVHYGLCRFMESIPWCTGTNITGYMMHLTAHKLLSYKYVSEAEFTHAQSMAIVRNPYARMVSIYSYNRFFGEHESFEHFCNDWYNHVTKAYRERGELEEWYTPCHAIPQFEYTHHEGRQIVRNVIKQEELKLLHPEKLKIKKQPKQEQEAATTANNNKTSAAGTVADDDGSTPLPLPPPADSSVSNLPPIVRDALVNMPHTNQRQLKHVWYQYYNQRTLDLVYEMYHADFEVFQYSPILLQRPDLQPPQRFSSTSSLTNKQPSPQPHHPTNTNIQPENGVAVGSEKAASLVHQNPPPTPPLVVDLELGTPTTTIVQMGVLPKNAK